MHAPNDPDCIFCKIIAGTIPCHKLHETATVLSFLDIGPLSRGHSLIVPKGHWVTLDQMPADIVADCAMTARQIGAAVVETTGVQGWNLLQNNGKVAGQVVMHVHFHVIPRAEGDGLGYRWSPKTLSKEEADELVKAMGAGQ